jgi:hypothetical protein
VEHWHHLKKNETVFRDGIGNKIQNLHFESIARLFSGDSVKTLTVKFGKPLQRLQ